MDSTGDLLEYFRISAKVYPTYTLHQNSKYNHGHGPRKESSETRWDRCEELGVGTFGRVYLETCLSIVDGRREKKRAVKVIEKDRVGELNIKREIVALSKFAKQEHQGSGVIVKFLGWFENGPEVHLAMEYFALGDLQRYVDDGLGQDEIKDITEDLLAALQIMHKEGFAHRDLKPGNIFVAQRPPQGLRWWVKIGDFGISKRVTDSNTAFRTELGTQHYTAPEIKGLIESAEDTSIYNQTVDIWSLGCVIYTLATREVPFPSIQCLRKFCDGKQQLQMGKDNFRLDMDGAEFLESLLQPHPRNRLTIEQAEKSKWLTRDHVSELLGTNPQDTRPIALTSKPFVGPSLTARSLQDRTQAVVANRPREIRSRFRASDSSNRLPPAPPPAPPLPEIQSRFSASDSGSHFVSPPRPLEIRRQSKTPDSKVIASATPPPLEVRKQSKTPESRILDPALPPLPENQNVIGTNRKRYIRRDRIIYRSDSGDSIRSSLSRNSSPPCPVRGWRGFRGRKESNDPPGRRSKARSRLSRDRDSLRGMSSTYPESYHSSESRNLARRRSPPSKSKATYAWANVKHAFRRMTRKTPRAPRHSPSPPRRIRHSSDYEDCESSSLRSSIISTMPHLSQTELPAGSQIINTVTTPRHHAPSSIQIDGFTIPGTAEQQHFYHRLRLPSRAPPS